MRREERLERKMDQHTEQKIDEVHQDLDAFVLRVLAWLSPQVDVSTLQAVFESLRVGINITLEARVPEFEAPSTEPAKDTVLAALLSNSKIPPPPP